MGQKPLSVGSNDDHIATFFICGIQDFFWGMTHRNEDFGYKFNAGGADLSLCSLQNPCKCFFIDSINLLMLLFLEFILHSPINFCMSRNRFNSV